MRDIKQGTYPSPNANSLPFVGPDSVWLEVIQVPITDSYGKPGGRGFGALRRRGFRRPWNTKKEAGRFGTERRGGWVAGNDVHDWANYSLLCPPVTTSFVPLDSVLAINGGLTLAAGVDNDDRADECRSDE